MDHIAYAAGFATGWVLVTTLLYVTAIQWPKLRFAWAIGAGIAALFGQPLATAGLLSASIMAHLCLMQADDKP